MAERQIKKVAIIGAGQMGNGIGVEFARWGCQVALQARHDETLKHSMESIKEDLDLMVETGLIKGEEAKAAFARVRTTKDMADAVKDADHVVESVPEILGLKQQVFAQLDELCPSDVTLATNSSSQRADDCAAQVKNHPERIFITHYWHPAPFVPLVEVIGGKRTDPKYLEKLAATLRGMRKRVVLQRFENLTGPAGWGNALQHPFEAIARKLIDDTGCDATMVDDLIRFGFGRRMPFTAIFMRYDIIGLDFFSRGPLGQWKPIKEHLDKSEFGMKNGQGFYSWPPEKAKSFFKDYNRELIHMMKKDMEKGDI
jgi:3-hydroxybutyryl-CoA dehydrogenase